MAESKMKAVYQVIDTKNADKPVWRRIGTAFVNSDESLNIMLDCVPLVGKVHVRELPEVRHGDDHREAA